MNKKKLLGLTVVGIALLLLPRRSSLKSIIDAKPSSTYKLLPVDSDLENTDDFSKKDAIDKKPNT